MSRIGKLPIPVPSGVSVNVHNNHVKVEGPKGTLERGLPAQISIKLEGETIVCRRPSDGREHRSLHGLTRTLVANMVTGVSAGFRKDLDLVGVGYRAQKQGNDVALKVLDTYKGISRTWDRTQAQIEAFKFGTYKGKWVGMTKQQLDQLSV